MAHIPSKVPTKIKLKNVRKVIMTMRFLLTMQHSTAFFEKYTMTLLLFNQTYMSSQLFG